MEFEYQLDRNFSVVLGHTFLALKLNVVKGCGDQSYKTNDVKKEHTEETKEAGTLREKKEDAPIPLVTHEMNILH